MNPRQRRAVLLLALAGAGLIGVFALVANYVSQIETEVGDKVQVLELTRPVAANQAVPDDAVRTREIPERWKPEAAFTARDQLVGLVAASGFQRDGIVRRRTALSGTAWLAWTGRVSSSTTTLSPTSLSISET